MPLVAELFGWVNKIFPSIPEGTKSKLPEVKEKMVLVNPNVHLGIEIEVENSANWLDPMEIWATKEDGSLRNSGREFVSIPLKGDDVPIALTWLFNSLKKKCSFSHRTSDHIHVDVRQLTLEQLNGVILTYLAVEPLLYKFVGRDRDKSIFCVPLYETELPIALCHDISYSLPSLHFGNTRYAGLNLDAIRKFGSLEFRHLYGTSDIPLILQWINLILSIYNYGSKTSFKNLTERIASLNTNSFYIAFIQDVFGSLATVLDLTTVKLDMERGVRSVKAALLTREFDAQLRKSAQAESAAVKFVRRLGVVGEPPKRGLGYTNIPSELEPPVTQEPEDYLIPVSIAAPSTQPNQFFATTARPRPPRRR